MTSRTSASRSGTSMSALMSVIARPISVGMSLKSFCAAGREAADAQVAPEHDHRQAHAAQQVAQVVVDRGEVGVVVPQLLVERGQLFVGRLQLLLRRLEFLVRALQLLVARLDFLVRRAQFLVRRLMLLGKRLQMLLRRRQFLRQPRAARIVALACALRRFRRRGAAAALPRK